jgi:hypothetical protein
MKAKIVRENKKEIKNLFLLKFSRIPPRNGTEKQFHFLSLGKMFDSEQYTFQTFQAHHTVL